MDKTPNSCHINSTNNLSTGTGQRKSNAKKGIQNNYGKIRVFPEI